MISITTPIILASQSPRRAHLLQQIGLSFSIQVSGMDEKIDPLLTSEDVVKKLSYLKAEHVAANIDKGIVIGADTIVVLGGKKIGKPTSESNAKELLRLLSGRTHTVYTGFALIDAPSKKSYIAFEKTDVTFRALMEHEIIAYVATGAPMDKAGAYGIQDDFGAVFVERISGDYNTVVGLPLAKFYTALVAFAGELGYLKGTV